jgi:hypothetical protein
MRNSRLDRREYRLLVESKVSAARPTPTQLLKLAANWGKFIDLELLNCVTVFSIVI